MLFSYIIQRLKHTGPSPSDILKHVKCDFGIKPVTWVWKLTNDEVLKISHEERYLVEDNEI